MARRPPTEVHSRYSIGTAWQHSKGSTWGAGIVGDLRSLSAHRRSRAAAEASVLALATAYGSDHPQVARWRHEQRQYGTADTVEKGSAQRPAQN